MIRTAVAAAAVAATFHLSGPPAPEPPVTDELPSPADTADREEAATQADRSTRTPLTAIPTPKPLTTPTNPPKPTPTPTPHVAPTSPAPDTNRTSTGGLPQLLLIIRAHESGGNYQAYNPGGCEGYGCGGAYQMHARYAPTWAARAGYPGMGSNAATWPPAVQDAVALDLYYSTNPDGAHWCNWTDYC